MIADLFTAPTDTDAEKTLELDGPIHHYPLVELNAVEVEPLELFGELAGHESTHLLTATDDYGCVVLELSDELVTILAADDDRFHEVVTELAMPMDEEDEQACTTLTRDVQALVRKAQEQDHGVYLFYAN